jgi:hypothetical protein
MVKNVQIATVLYEVLKTLLTPQTIEEKLCFFCYSKLFYEKIARKCAEYVIFLPDKKIRC